MITGYQSRNPGIALVVPDCKPSGTARPVMNKNTTKPVNRSRHGFFDKRLTESAGDPRKRWRIYIANEQTSDYIKKTVETTRTSQTVKICAVILLIILSKQNCIPFDTLCGISSLKSIRTFPHQSYMFTTSDLESQLSINSYAYCSICPLAVHWSHVNGNNYPAHTQILRLQVSRRLLTNLHHFSFNSCYGADSRTTVYVSSHLVINIVRPVCLPPYRFTNSYNYNYGSSTSSAACYSTTPTIS